MDPHLQEYLTNRLTPTGLRKLRQHTGSMSDEELARQMRADWDSFDSDGTMPDTKPPRMSVWRRVTRYAAVIAIALLTASSLYLYHGNRQLAAQDITVVTGGGERASVKLPDGSMVSLNSNSALTYSAAGFASKVRSVSFEGEGFFEVTKDKAHRFTISTGHLLVTVHGTAFNLCSRADEGEASLYLEEGAVELRSLDSGECISVKPGDMAVLDYATGRFSLSSSHDGAARTAWRAGDLVYINEPLANVLQSLERNFNYSITLDDTRLANAPFTGTLSGTSIYDAMKILEITFSLRCSGSDGTLRLRTP